MTETGTPPSRRLLTNGQALRLDVQAPRGGGGEKYEPQTAEQASRLLRPMVRAAAAIATALPTELRADDRVYVEARLLPNYIAASQFPEALLRRIDAVPVGSRTDKAAYRTKSRSTIVGTRRMILAVTDEGLESFADLTERHGHGRSEEQAFDDLKKLDDVTVSQPPGTLLDAPMSEAVGTWEAVLHPGGNWRGEPVRANDATLEKWFALVRSLGGTVYEDYVRFVGGLTFTPVTLPPETVHDAAKFNPLRVLRPMPGIRPRPGFGTRGTTTLQPPNEPTPVALEPRVAVFDGGLGGVSPLFPLTSTSLTPETEEAAPFYMERGSPARPCTGCSYPASRPRNPRCPWTVTGCCRLL